MKVLVTGAAGFIGMHACRRLLERGDQVTGLDNLNDYYDPSLKQARLEQLARYPAFRFEPLDIADREPLQAVFDAGRFDRVVHLAAQAGVRYSLVNPGAYVQSNLVGFANVLEACRVYPVEHLVYASSSSVYGANNKLPFSESDPVDHPVSLYAATKRSNELMAHAASHLGGLPVTGLRFFTAYGPWGRPDMAYWSFARAILEGRTIDVFNEGRMSRDFTYIDDVVEGLVRVVDKAPAGEPGAPSRIFNIGNHAPVPLVDFIAMLEARLGRKANLRMMPMQPAEVVDTCADTSALAEWVGYSPSTPLGEGLVRFVEWFLPYHARRP